MLDSTGSLDMGRALRGMALLGIVAAGCSGSTQGSARPSSSGGLAGTSGGGMGGAGGYGGGNVPGAGGTDQAAVPSGGAMGQGGTGAGGASSVPSFSWRTLPSLTKKRQSPMGVAVGDAMYVIGGFDSSGLLPDVERLNAGQAAWEVAPSLPNGQCCAAVGVIGHVIALAGGYQPDGQTPTDQLLLFDTTTGVWQQGPALPTARVNAMGAVWKDKFMVIGGSTRSGSTQPTGVIEIFDAASNGWTSSPLQITPRASGVAVVDADRVYVIGGAGQGSLYGDLTVEIITADAVTPGPLLGLGRVQAGGGLLPVGIVVAGGWTNQQVSGTVEGLLGASSQWQDLPPMPTARSGTASAVVNGSLIIAGGGQFQGASWIAQDAVEALAAD